MSIATATAPSGTAVTQEFEDLFNEHAQLVYRTAYGVTGRHEDAEDVLQTIFLRLMRRDLPPDLVRNPKGYLYRAARHAEQSGDLRITPAVHISEDQNLRCLRL